MKRMFIISSLLVAMLFAVGGVMALLWLPPMYKRLEVEPEDFYISLVLGISCLFFAVSNIFDFLSWLKANKKIDMAANIFVGISTLALLIVGVFGVFETSVASVEMLLSFIPAAAMLASLAGHRYIRKD